MNNVSIDLEVLKEALGAQALQSVILASQVKALEADKALVAARAASAPAADQPV